MFLFLLGPTRTKLNAGRVIETLNRRSRESESDRLDKPLIGEYCAARSIIYGIMFHYFRWRYAYRADPDPFGPLAEASFGAGQCNCPCSV
jgi:hypothetical protein